jgi:predicted lipopolysaccharide heptosyltransferase III
VNVLLLQLKRIGDLILTTPAIRGLREAYPAARLALVADSSCSGLLDSLAVDECWSYHKGSGLRGLAGWGPNAWLKNELLAFRPDWTLDFTGTDRSAFLCALSRSNRRVTFLKFRKKPLRKFLYTDFVKSSVSERHTADHYTDLLAPLGIELENVPLDLRLSEEAFATARALLANAGVTGPYAVVHAGTARAEKYWTAEGWAEVISFLHAEYGFATVLTGSQDPHERDHLSEIKSHLRHDCLDLSGKTNLACLAAVIKGARLFCGVDTAAMHLADAMKTPCVALFGPTNPYHWRPRHTKSVVLRSCTATPFSSRQHGGPMRELTVASTIDGVREVLSEGNTTGGA